MRLDVAGDNLLERIGLLSGMVPTPLVEVSFGSGYCKTIVAGARLGVYEALKEADADATELAARVGCSRIGTEALANALTGMDLLVRRRGRYALSKRARKFLLRGTKSSMVDGLLFLGYCHELLDGLEDAIRTGEVIRIHDRDHPPEFWEAYMGALGSFARMLGGQVIGKIRPSSPPKRVLDVGGGHGLYPVLLCRKYPDLTGEVLDLPGACAAGRKVVADEGMADRVTFREGDFRTAEWGTGFDLVLICHVLHNATEDEAKLLLGNAFAALNPGGTVVVYDAAHDGTDGAIDASAGWNELFFFMISGAQAWPEATIEGWMVEAGFEAPRTRGLMAAPEVVMTARKPA